MNLHDNYGRLTDRIPGIVVVPDQRGIIDTDLAAQAGNWDAETKKAVEERLLSHPDFGRKVVMDSRTQIGGEPINTTVFALWFAPDQDMLSLADEHGEFMQKQQWYRAWSSVGLPVGEAEIHAPAQACAWREEPEAGVVMACQRAVEEGSLYCDFHSKVKV